MATEITFDISEWVNDLDVLQVLMGVVGVSRITEDNWKECYQRISAYEQLIGALRMDASTNTPHPYTPAEIHAAVGKRSGYGDLTDDEFAVKLYQVSWDKSRQALIEYAEAMDTDE